MKQIYIQKIRLKNFRCFKDSGDIPLESGVNILLGKNESGKSALLKGINWFLQKDKKLEDNDKCVFRDSENEIDIGHICLSHREKKDENGNNQEQQENASSCEATCNTQSDYKIEYSPEFIINEIFQTLDQLRDIVQQDYIQTKEYSQGSVSEDWPSKVFSNIEKIQNKENKENKDDLKGIEEATGLLLRGNLHKGMTAFPRFESDESRYSKIREKLGLISQENPKYVENYLGAAIFIEDVEILDGHTLRKEIYRDQKHPWRKILKTLGVTDITEASCVFTNKYSREEYAKQLSKSFNGFFDSGTTEYCFEFRCEAGDLVVLQVRDEKSEKHFHDFNERSTGFRWLFSAFVEYLNDMDTEKDTAKIILIDEPGRHLHPEAQQELVGLLQKLGERHQIIYSTHSPYMIDTNRIDQVKGIEKSENGAGAKYIDLMKSIRNGVFSAVHCILGIPGGYPYLITNKTVIFEGFVDYALVNAMNQYFRNQNNGVQTIDQNNIQLIFAEGAGNVPVLAKFIMSSGEADRQILSLLDSDDGGDAAAKKLSCDYKQIGDIVDGCVTTEDLFTPKEYREMFASISEGAKEAICFEKESEDMPSQMLGKAHKYFAKQNKAVAKKELNNIKADVAKEVTKRLSNDLGKISKETLGRFKTLIEAISNHFDNKTETE